MTEAPCVAATCSADSFTSTGELHERLYVPHKHSNPEPTEHGGEPPGHEEAHPEHGDPELDREQNQPQEQDPTLFPAGQAGGDGGLVGLVNALAVLDRRADPRPRGLIEAILEGKPPFGVASLLNHAVHRAWLRSYSWLEGEAGAGRPPRRWRGSPALRLTGSTR